MEVITNDSLRACIGEGVHAELAYVRGLMMEIITKINAWHCIRVRDGFSLGLIVNPPPPA